MVSYSNEGEPSGEQNVWSNSIGFLISLQRLEDHLEDAYLREEVNLCVKYSDALIIRLARMMKPEQRKQIEELINEAAKKHRESRRMSGSGAAIIRKRQLVQEAMQYIREVMIQTGSFMWDEGLTFKKGIDPNEAWALG